MGLGYVRLVTCGCGYRLGVTRNKNLKVSGVAITPVAVAVLDFSI